MHTPACHVQVGVCTSACVVGPHVPVDTCSYGGVCPGACHLTMLLCARVCMCMHMCGLCVHVCAGVCVHVYDLYVCTVGLGTDTRSPD